MTLAAWLLCRDGWVVAADRIAMTTRWESRPDHQKLTEVAPNVGVALTGSPVISETSKVEGQLPRVRFSALETIVRFVQAEGFHPEDITFWPSLYNAIDGDLRALFRQFPQGGSPLAASEGVLFQARFFFIENTVPNTARLKVHYAYKQEWTFHPEWALGLTTKLGFLGISSVANEVLLGTDPRFDDVRAEPLIARVKVADPATLSTADALAFARRMIIVTSERLRMLDSTPTRIGSRIDAALVGRSGEFAWLARDA